MAKPLLPDNNRRTPIHMAAKNFMLTLSSFWFPSPPNANSLDQNGITPINLAAVQKRHVESVQFFATLVKNPNAPD